MFKQLKFIVRPLLLAGLILSACKITAQTVDRLIDNSHFGGDGADKKVVVIVGDGFSTDADRQTYKDFVNSHVIEGAFSDGPFAEDLSAFDIIQIDTVSNDSGVTQINSEGDVTSARDTALDYRFSGDFNRCWLEPGPDSNDRIQTILNDAHLMPDFLIVVLNEPGFGGCARGNSMAIPMGIGSEVVSHEIGHSIGGLCDEYNNGTSGLYMGGEPGCVNLTINTNRESIKWGEFIDPNTPISTLFDPNRMNTSRTVGAFEGGNARNSAGIWRPTNTGMMNNNTEWGPVHYKRIKEILEPHHHHSFDNTYSGDFDGDGDDDAVIHNGNYLSLYLSDGRNLQNSGFFSFTRERALHLNINNDSQLYVGDFNGDGADDLYLYTTLPWLNSGHLVMLKSNKQGFEVEKEYFWSMPRDITNHSISESEKILVSDFNGDGKDDLIMINPNQELFHMYASKGDGLIQVSVYSEILPGITMDVNDQYYVADFDGDGMDDLYLYNDIVWWGSGVLTMLRSTGTGIILEKTYSFDSLPNWNFRQGGQIYVADFDGDGKDDLYGVKPNSDLNGKTDVGKLRSTGKGLEVQRVWEKQIGQFVDDKRPWSLTGTEQIYVADINGDGMDDFYMYEPYSFWTTYLTSFISSNDGDLIQSKLHISSVDKFRLSDSDKFIVSDFSGDGRDDLFAFRSDWFALLRSDPGKLTVSARHFKWIYDAEYHRDGLW